MIPQRAAIVGLGLMGGSLGLALRAAQPSMRIGGHDADPDTASAALRRGAVTDLFERAGDPPRDAEVVALAVPPRTAASLVADLLRSLPPRAVLLDLSSVMLPSVAASLTAPSGAERFVPTHPLAGSERSGIEAARADLFAGASVLIGAPYDAEAAARAAGLWTSIGARPAPIAPALHDALVALTSHLPYAASVALVRTLRRTGAMNRALAGAAGPALRDTTRVASSPAPLWEEILALNAPKVIPALELLEREVRGLRRAVEKGGPELTALLEEARAFRAELLP